MAGLVLMSGSSRLDEPTQQGGCESAGAWEFSVGNFSIFGFRDKVGMIFRAIEDEGEARGRLSGDALEVMGPIIDEPIGLPCVDELRFRRVRRCFSVARGDHGRFGEAASGQIEDTVGMLVGGHAGEVSNGVALGAQFKQSFAGAFDAGHVEPAVLIENLKKAFALGVGERMGIEAEFRMAMVAIGQHARFDAESAHGVGEGQGVIEKDAIDIEGEK